MNAPLQPKGLSLRVNFRWVFLSQLVYLASQWAILSSLTKLSDLKTVGLFGLALAITAPINFGLSLGLRQAQASDVNDQYIFSQYIGLRSLASIILVLACIIGVAIFNNSSAAIIVVGLYAVAKAIETYSDTTYGLFQKYERMDLAARSMIIRGLGALGFFLGLFYLAGTRDAEALAAGIIGICLAWLAVLLCHDLPTAKRLLATMGHHAPEAGKQRPGAQSIRPTWNLSKIAPLFWHSLPLGISAFLIALQLNIPRYFIEWRLGGEALGYFTPMIFILSAGSQFINPLVRAAVPRLARHFAARRFSAFIQLIGKVAAFAAFCGLAAFLVAFFLGAELLTLLYSAEYAKMESVFALLMAAGILRYAASALQMATVAARRFRTQLAQQIGVLSASFAAGYLLIGPSGLIGAGWAVLAGAACHFLIVLGGMIWSLRSAKLQGPST